MEKTVRRLVWVVIGLLVLAGTAAAALAWQHYWRADYWIEAKFRIDMAGRDAAARAERMAEAEIRILGRSDRRCLVVPGGEDTLVIYIGANDTEASPGESSETRRRRLDANVASLKVILETPGSVGIYLVDAWGDAAGKLGQAKDSERWRRALAGERIPGFRLINGTCKSASGEAQQARLLVPEAPIVGDEQIRYARTVRESALWITQVKLTVDGARRLGEATDPARVRHGTDRLAFVMDGVAYAMPAITSRLSGRRVDFAACSSREEAEMLRQGLNAGAFPLPGAVLIDCRVADAGPPLMATLLAQIRGTFRWLVDFIGALGYAGIFILMAMESSVLPVPSELVMPPAGFLAFQGKMSAPLAIICGTVGSLIGAYVNYFVSRRLGRPLVLKYGRYVLISEKKFVRAEAFFLKHGEVATFIGRLLPVVRHLISIPAGLAGMNHWKFSLYTLLGAAIWCTVLTYFGYFIGAEQEVIKRHFSKVLLGAAVFSAAVIALYVWRLRRRPAGEQATDPGSPEPQA